LAAKEIVFTENCIDVSLQPPAMYGTGHV